MSQNKSVEEVVKKIVGLIDLLGGDVTVSVDYQDGEEPIEFILQEKVAEELTKELNALRQTSQEREREIRSEVTEEIRTKVKNLTMLISADANWGKQQILDWCFPITNPNKD